MRFSEYLIMQWYRPRVNFLTALLRPWSWLFGAAVYCRRYIYRHRLVKSVNFSVPIILVGNLTIGGTGKTPVVIWLAAKLRGQGARPGIVTRGFGGLKNKTVLSAFADSDPRMLGDEAVILARRTGCPVRVSKDRVNAVRALLDETDCNIIISDDGLQHYRLGRTFEIILADAKRGWGNGLLLPAGPLREPTSRMAEADAVWVKGQDFILKGANLVNLADEAKCKPLSAWRGMLVHAVAGIGYPQRFFADLMAAGLKVIPHAFCDHNKFQQKDITFGDNLPVVMTEKDAVKCQAFATSLHWYYPISVCPGEKMLKIVENNSWM